MKKVFTLLIAIALLLTTGMQHATAQTTREVPGTYTTIQAAIDASVAGDIVNIASGTYSPAATINVDEDVTIIGQGVSTVLQTSGGSRLLNITAAGATIKNLKIEKTDKVNQNIIYIGANNVTIQNNIISGLFVIDDSQVERGFEIAGGLAGLLIDGNTINALRQPAYINNGVQGTISNNLTSITKGWVVVTDCNITFSGNSWGTGSDINYYDIALINQSGSVNNYPDIVTVSANNNDAIIENQHTSYASPILSIVHVNASVTSGNGSILEPYKTIAEALPRVAIGGKIDVAAGTYNEHLTVTKNIYFRGPNYNINPNTETRVGEAIITNLPTGRAFTINAGNTDVSIDGFKFDGGSPIHDGNETHFPRTSDVTFRNNVVTNSNNIFTGTDTSWKNVVISNNKFQDVNGVTLASAIMIQDALSATVTNNTFTNINYAAMLLDGISTSIVTGNIITTTGAQAIQLANEIGDATVNSNTITAANSTAKEADKGAIRMYGSAFTGAVIISGNTISGGYNGITIKDGQDITGKDITVTNNSITGLTAGNAIYHGGTGTLNATCNWYGTSDATIVAGKISGPVEYAPFNVSDGGACLGGIPASTRVAIIGTPAPSDCGTLDVPVTVQNFNAVANVSLVLNYDAAVLEYQSVDINTALTGAFSNGAAGQFILGRNSGTSEITLADNTVLFTLHFNILSSVVGGSTTDITWDLSDPSNCEFASGGSTPTVYESIFSDLTGIIIPEWLVRNITQGTNFCTIQAAIDDANPLGGDVIEALAATYTENLTIDKSVTLLGPNAIKSPNTEPRVPEAIIQPPVVGVHAMVGAAAGISVTMKGFTVDMVNAGTDERFFDQVGKAGTTWTFEDNVFKNAKECGTGNWRLTGVQNTGLVFNLIDNYFTNNAVSNGIAIWDALFTANIRDNVWENNGGWAMNLNQVSGTIENNTFIDNDPNAPDNVWYNNQNGLIIAAGNNDVKIINNSFINNYSSINIYENTAGALDISGNFFQHNITYAIKISALTNPGQLTLGAHINSFTVLATGAFAIQNLTDPLKGYVADATCNWFDTNDPSAFASLLDGDVDAVPFLIDGTDFTPGTPGFQPTLGCDEIPPTVTGPMDELTVSGCDLSAAPAPVTTVAALEAMGAVIADIATADVDLVVTSSDVSAGTCPIVITRTYTITDQSGNSSTIDQTITITHLTPPAEVGGPVPSASTVECEADATAPGTLPAVQDMCGNVLTPGSAIKKEVFTNTFDQAVALLATEADDVWYTDRYAPAGFVAQESFDGGMRLKHSISAADGASGRPGGFSSTFYNTQGRKYNLGVATDEISIELYIPAGWATTNKRMAGVWGTAVDATNAISAYPNLEFTSDGNNPRFRVWETGTGNWIDLGLPSGFAYNSWITLKIRVLPAGGIVYTAGSKNYVDNSTSSDRIDNVILQGYNYDPNVVNGGVTYDIYWDDFTWNDDYTELDCEGQIAYTYIFEDCAGLAFAWTYTYTVERITAPDEVGSVANSSTVYNIDNATAPTVLPVVEDVCGAVLNPTPGSPVMEDLITGCTGTRTYTYTYVDCADLQYEWTYTYTLSTSTVSGTLKYNNTVKTAMENMVLTLNPGGLTATTNASGEFSFAGLCAGTYTIEVTTNPWKEGGINSTDAGAVNAWSAYFGDIEAVKYLAGDVIVDKSLDPSDALKIQRKFVFHENFPPATPDWVYWKADELISSNTDPYDNFDSPDVISNWPTEITVEVNGNIPNLELYGMATGDFNGSLVPTLLKSASPSLVLAENSNMQIGANQAFELPLRAASAMQVGAVSMILDVPAELVKVQNVRIKGSNEPVMWAINGNELRIGWNSLSPVNVAENGTLLTLDLMTTNAFAQGQSMDIALPFNPLNELANGKFEALDNAELLVAKVGNQAVGTIDIDKNGGLLFSNYPNPFSKVTKLEYDLPVDGKVTINLYNNLGQLVAKLVDADQTAGQHMFRYENNSLQPGIYVAKLRLVNSETDMVGTIKLSVQK